MKARLGRISRGRWIVIGLVLAALAIAAVFIIRGRANAASPYQTQRAERGTLTATVGATGTVRARQSAVLLWQATGTVERVDVEVGGRLSRMERNEIAQKVEWMFGLDQDFSAFYKAARLEPKLRHAKRLARGRVLRSPTFFEDILKTILTTNTLWAATKRMNLNLITAFGDPLSLPRTRLEGPRTFPGPEKIAASTEDMLRQTVRVGYRAPAILELATRVASGDLAVEAFKTSTLPTLELRKELLKIRGIGPYAAATLCRLLGRHEKLGLDSWSTRKVWGLRFRGRKTKEARVARFYAPFDLQNYELCFFCHEQKVVLEPKSMDTSFRNGNVNMHYLHVNREKGRTCRACHAEHASNNPVHIRDSVPYGQWEMPIEFEKTATGEVCITLIAVCPTACNTSEGAASGRSRTRRRGRT